jgi:hypothetical protein
MIGGVDAAEIPDQHFSIDVVLTKAVVSLHTVSTIAVVSLSGRECRDFRSRDGLVGLNVNRCTSGSEYTIDALTAA